MPTAAVKRGIRLALAIAATAGAIVGATRAYLQDRQHSRAVRDQLRYLKQTGV